MYNKFIFLNQNLLFSEIKYSIYIFQILILKIKLNKTVLYKWIRKLKNYINFIMT